MAIFGIQTNSGRQVATPIILQTTVCKPRMVRLFRQYQQNLTILSLFC